MKQNEYKKVKYLDNTTQTESIRPAKIIRSPSGSFLLKIEGEKYLFPGVPRGEVLERGGSLYRLKRKIKRAVFNQVYAAMEPCRKDMIPIENCAPFIKELWRVFEKMEKAEQIDDMKGRIRLIRDVVCFFLQEDDAYRFRFQWFLENLNMVKCKLSKADKYYFSKKLFDL